MPRAFPKTLARCRKCGSKPEETQICINLGLGDSDFDICQCSNEECSWHLQPNFYYGNREAFDNCGLYPKENKYLYEFLDGERDYWYGGRHVNLWQKYHFIKKKRVVKPKTALVKAEKKELNLDPIGQLEL